MTRDQLTRIVNTPFLKTAAPNPQLGMDAAVTESARAYNRLPQSEQNAVGRLSRGVPAVGGAMLGGAAGGLLGAAGGGAMGLIQGGPKGRLKAMLERALQGGLLGAGVGAAGGGVGGYMKGNDLHNRFKGMAEGVTPVDHEMIDSKPPQIQPGAGAPVV